MIVTGTRKQIINVLEKAGIEHHMNIKRTADNEYDVRQITSAANPNAEGAAIEALFAGCNHADFESIDIADAKERLARWID